jgi:crossover junction endodeoxyribonuclease RuvC
MGERLVALFRQVTEVIVRFAPDEAAVEETFVNKNPASTLKLGVARGVVVLAPAERGLKVIEYSTNLVKKSVVGAGHADKTQVQLMVRRLLPGCVIASADAADALAVAICHAHHAGTLNAWGYAQGHAGGAPTARARA